ncbi:MAG: hypothetical protein ABIV39_11895 [Verrucomicrobiota bacterium]
MIAALHFKFKHDVEAYKKELIAKGEKLTIAEWIPRSSANGNAARVFMERVRPISEIRTDHHPSMMRMVAEGRAEASWKSDENYDLDFKRRTNVWEINRKDFEENAQALAELREAIDKGEMIFPVAYEQGFHAQLPHLARVKQGVVWLLDCMVNDLHGGNKTDAAANLKAALQFQKNYKGEPFLISHLVRIACLNVSFSATWEALQNSNWTDDNLKDFQEDWAAIPFGNLDEVLSMERAMGIRMIAEARETGQDPQETMIGGSTTTVLDDLNEFKAEILNDPKAAFNALLNQPNKSLWKWVKSYQDELNLLKMWQSGLKASREIEKTQAYQPAMNKLREELKTKETEDDDFLFGDSKTIVSGTFSKIVSAKIAQQLALTACALERFKLENKRYPNDLKELVPKILVSIPSDPIDGQPLRYQLNSDGTFLLYSVGENGVDDGGDVKRAKSSSDGKWIRPRHPIYGRDWVWPLPGTEEQIADWERHESGKAK